MTNPVPVPGTIEDKFDRVYIVVNPNPAKGPPTFRVSNQDQIGGGSGGGSGTTYDFTAEAPIVVDTLGSNTGGSNVVTTSMDIQDLDSRTD